MKYNLPILTLVALGVFAIYQAVQQPSPERVLLADSADLLAEAGQPSPANSSEDGNQLLEHAAKALAQHQGVQASIRHRVSLFGHQIAGTGHYIQFNDRAGRPLRFRWELKLPQGEHLLTVQQVCDGRFLWFRRSQGPTNSLSRVDLRRLADHGQGQGSSPRNSTSVGSLIGAGGVPGLLKRLATSFDFEAPRPDRLRNLPVWRLRGTWNTDKLAQLLPDQAASLRAGKSADLSKLPAHLPQQVIVVLGRDERIQFFPYLLEYRRKDKKKYKSLVTVEFFQVAVVPDLNASAFTIDPGEQVVYDETDEWLAR